jgi:hypothetical protein
VEGTEQPHHDDYVYALRDEDAYLHADDDKQQIVEPFDPPSIVCQFCGKSWKQVPMLFQAKRRTMDPNTSALADVWICNECVARMAQILAEEPSKRLRSWREWTPGGLIDRRTDRGHNGATSGPRTARSQRPRSPRGTAKGQQPNETGPAARSRPR